VKTTELLTFVAILLSFGASAPAQVEQKAFLDQFEKTFEPGGSVQTKDFIPEALMQAACTPFARWPTTMGSTTPTSLRRRWESRESPAQPI
jgi:hypothetical protein